MTTLSDKPAQHAAAASFCIAPENIRAGDDVDDQVEALGQTLLAGQIMPLFVRKGRKGEAKLAVLDGRRRLLAFQGLIDDKKLAADHPIAYILCETPEEIAAAAVITNAARLDISMADYLLAIHRLTGQFKTHDEIGRILGLETKEVRKLAKLGALDMRFLQSFKRDELDLQDLRRLSRISDPEVLEQFAQKAADDQLAGWEINQTANRHVGPTATSGMARLVGAEAYQDAGGRIERDLFEELPDRWLDVDLLQSLWLALVQPTGDVLKARGLLVNLSPAGSIAPEGCCELPWFEWGAEGDKEAIKVANSHCEAIGLEARDLREAGNIDGWVHKFVEYAIAGLAWHALRSQPLTTAGVCLAPSDAGGVKISFFVERAALDEHQNARRAAMEGTNAGGSRSGSSPASKLPQSAVRVDTDGYGHLLHQRVTTIAGRGLALSLANNAQAAYDTQLAWQFHTVVINHYTGDDHLLQINVRRTMDIHKPDDVFQKPIVERLLAYKAEWTESGLHPFQWIRTLAPDRKGDLFALLTALQVDTSEAKTNTLRRGTRAEAAHIARAIGHDIRDHWLPTADVFSEFSKKQLLGFVKQMGVQQATYAKMKVAELAPAVAKLAADHRFVPPAFSFELDEPALDPDDGNDEADLEAEDQDEDEDADVETLACDDEVAA